LAPAQSPRNLHMIKDDPPPKRLSTRNNNLTVEVPKKRISNS